MLCTYKNFPRLLFLESLLLCLLLSAFHLAGGLVAAGSEWPDVLCLMLVAETSDLTMTARDNMFFAVWCIGFVVSIVASLVSLARKFQ